MHFTDSQLQPICYTGVLNNQLKQGYLHNTYLCICRSMVKYEITKDITMNRPVCTNNKSDGLDVRQNMTIDKKNTNFIENIFRKK